MDAIASRLLRAVAAVGLAVTTLSAADAAIRIVQNGSPNSPYLHQPTLPQRLRVAMFRPAHIPFIGQRADLTGDTAPSSKYYKVTNISAEVGSATGYTTAINNDGRILYVDEAPAVPSIQFQSYLVNNGGTFAKLPFPFNDGAQLYVQASALNENGEAVGDYAYEGAFTEFNANVAWSLHSATGVGIAYFGGYRNGSGVNGLNDEDEAVGYDGLKNVAAIFLAASSPPGRAIDLKGLAGGCPASGSAEAINDAGEIVGETCNQAVRFSRTGFAQQLLPDVPKGTTSYADAINEAGDIVGTVGNRAFLNHLGKTVSLPLPADCGGPAQGFGVNATDDVVGDCGNGGSDKPFLYHHGRSYDLNTLIAPDSGWQLVGAFGINDHGEIIGTGYYNGTYFGISLKPPA